MVTITYDPKKTEPAKLAKVIETLEYGVKEVPVEDKDERSLRPTPAPLPTDAPESFATAFRAARAAERPMLIDFGATWCAPCVKLKKKTLVAPAVVEALEGVDLIFVDVDEHPKLAEAYGVDSVPDLFFVDKKGNVIGRLQEFEEPEPFLTRLEEWRSREGGLMTATIGARTSVPSEEVAKTMGLTNKVRVHGRLIGEVEPGGPAASAGLQEGDVLLKLGPNALYSADDIADLLSVSSPGDRLLVVFKRAGEAGEREVTVTLSGEPVDAEAQPGLRWEYSGLGQLPQALEVARAKKKKVLVGLSGAET